MKRFQLSLCWQTVLSLFLLSLLSSPSCCSLSLHQVLCALGQSTRENSFAYKARMCFYTQDKVSLCMSCNGSAEMKYHYSECVQLRVCICLHHKKKKTLLHTIAPLGGGGGKNKCLMNVSNVTSCTTGWYSDTTMMDTMKEIVWKYFLLNCQILRALFMGSCQNVTYVSPHIFLQEKLYVTEQQVTRCKCIPLKFLD